MKTAGPDTTLPTPRRRRSAGARTTTLMSLTLLAAFGSHSCRGPASTAKPRGVRTPVTVHAGAPTTSVSPISSTTIVTTSAPAEPTTVAAVVPTSPTSASPTTSSLTSTTVPLVAATTSSPPTTSSVTTSSPPTTPATTAPSSTTTVPVTTPVTAFPTADNTGPRTNQALSVHVGNLVVTQPYTVVEGLEIRGSLYIAASATGTVVRNVKVVWPDGQANPGDGVWAMVDSRAQDVTIEDCVVAGSDLVQTGINLGSGPSTVTRCEVTGVADGINVNHDATVTDSYLHHMSVGPSGDWHTDTIQMNLGRNVVIRHNTIINEQIQTSAVGLWAELGAIDNVLVEDNLIGGGGFTIYATQVGYPMTNVRFVSNRFTTSVFALVGYWATDSDGYCGLLYPSGLPADLVFSDNVIHETGAPVTR